MTLDTPTTDSATVVGSPERGRVLAGLADGTVETVADLRVRGRADEIAAEMDMLAELEPPDHNAAGGDAV